MISMDTEIWRPVTGYEGMYEVSNYGQVKSLDRVVRCKTGRSRFIKSRILRQVTSKVGTNPMVCLAQEGDNKNYLVADLVYQAFFENADVSDVVKHKDKDTTNNRVDNLYVEVIIDLPGEEWRPVVGYEGLYEISNKGRLKSCKRSEIFFRSDTNVSSIRNRRERLIITDNDNLGYEKLQLNKYNDAKDFMIHRLVAEVFIPNPENKPQVNHIDGDPSNNCVENLEWCTAKENVQDYIRKRGRKNLTDLIKDTQGHKIICVDTQESFRSNNEVMQYFAHGGSVVDSILKRTCYYGYSFVFESDVNSSDFDFAAYLLETKNRYRFWNRSVKPLLEVEAKTHSLQNIGYKLVYTKFPIEIVPID